MNKNRIVVYAGISTTTIYGINGKPNTVTYAFHTSNKPKYAVWCNLPESGIKSVTFDWHKMPENTTVAAAVYQLTTHYAKTNIGDMLCGISSKWDRKISKPRAKKGEGVHKVTVVVSDKKLTDTEARNRKDVAAAIILARIGKAK